MNLSALGRRFVASGLFVFSILQLQAEPAAKSRLFILSGQSNMKHVDPEVSFTPALKQAFPEDEILVVKLAHSGEPIRRWYHDWRPESGELAKGTMVGDIYDKLIKQVEETLQGRPAPESVTFVWMQGEADTASPDMANVYEDSLKGLIAQVRNDLQRPDCSVVIGRISDYAKFPEGSKTVRDAEMKIAAEDPKAAWVDTDDLNGKRDDLHYTAEGYRILGERFAEKAVELVGRTDGSATRKVEKR